MSQKDEDAGYTALSTSGESVFSGSLLPEAFCKDLLGAYNVVAAVDCTLGQVEFLKACVSAHVPCLAMTLSSDHAHLLEQRLSEYTLQKFGDSECPTLFRSDYKKPATVPSKNIVKQETNGTQPEAVCHSASKGRRQDSQNRRVRTRQRRRRVMTSLRRGSRSPRRRRGSRSPTLRIFFVLWLVNLSF